MATIEEAWEQADAEFRWQQRIGGAGHESNHPRTAKDILNSIRAEKAAVRALMLAVLEDAEIEFAKDEDWTLAQDRVRTTIDEVTHEAE